MDINIINLADVEFTLGLDEVSVDGKIVNGDDSFVSTLRGDDIVEAILPEDYYGETPSAIENSGSIKTGSGNDSIIGRNLAYERYGIWNRENALIHTGKGHDSIIGTARHRPTDAIRNQGTIFMAAGHDLITNIDESYSYSGTGVINEQTGIINTGFGNDSIILDSGDYHLSTALYNHGLITTGSGNDYIDATENGRGFNDPGFPSSPNIVNTGTINMGKDNDTLTGAVIKNSGTINMGIGSDFLGARVQGGGYINMGPGNDSVSIKVWPLMDNSQIINGGSKFDQVEFSFDDLNQYPLSYGIDEFSFEDHVGLNITGNTVEVGIIPFPNDPTWTLSGFELFTFDGESYTFEELSDL